MTVHRLDEVLDAKPARPRPAAPLPAVSSVRYIPRMCSCTWRLRLGAIEATWTLTETDRSCKMHGGSGGESGAGK